MINIFDKLFPSYGGKVITDSKYIKDAVKNKNLEDVVKDIDNELARQQGEISALHSGNYVTVTAEGGDTSVEDIMTREGITPAVDTIYRIGAWDGTQYDDTAYSEYSWNQDNGYKFIAAHKEKGIDTDPTADSHNLVESGGVQNELALGAVYDVSAKNPTSGPNNDGKWESLSALLSDANLNTLIPTSVRKGGMSIKFVQSSDNKYVQYRLMSDSFNTTPANWQKQGAEVNVSHNNQTDGVNIGVDNQDTFDLAKQKDLVSINDYLLRYTQVFSFDYNEDTCHYDANSTILLLRVNPNDELQIKSSGTVVYGVLKEIPDFGNSNNVNLTTYYANGYSRTVASNNFSLTIPNDGHYILFQASFPNGDRTPQSVLRNGKDLLLSYKDSVVTKDMVEMDVEEAPNSIDLAFSDNNNNMIGYFGDGYLHTPKGIDFENEGFFDLAIADKNKNYLLGIKGDKVYSRLIKRNIVYITGNYTSADVENIILLHPNSTIKTISDIQQTFVDASAREMCSIEKYIYIVGPIAYDMYQGMGGDTFFAGLAGHSADEWDDYSATMENVHIIGIGSVTINLLCPAAYQNFLIAAINVKGNAEIANININMSNCRYAIHDQVVYNDSEHGAIASLNGGRCTYRIYRNVNTYTNTARGINCGYVGPTNVIIDNCSFRCSNPTNGKCYTYHDGIVNILIKDSVIDGGYFHAGDNRYRAKFINSYINGPWNTGYDTGAILDTDYGEINVVNSYIKNGIERQYTNIVTPIHYINRVMEFNETII